MANLVLADQNLRAAEDAILTAILPTGSGGAKLRLFTNNIVISQTTLQSDPIECGLTGYTAQPLNFPASTLDSVAHNAFSFSTVVVFTTSDAVGITVYGAYILDPSSGLLIGGYNFPAPVTFNLTNPIVCQVEHTYESKYT